MSAIKERLKEQAARAAEREKVKAPEMERPPEAIIETSLNGALKALASHALAVPSEITSTRPRLASVPQSIERTGCSFIDSTFLLLERIECPPDVREIVLCICGLSGGDYENYSKITQAQMATRLGVSVKTVRERLDALFKWEFQTNRTAIEIKERERNPTTKHYETTEYRPVIVWYAAEYIRRLDALRLKPTHFQNDTSPDTNRVFKEIAYEVAEDMPLGPTLARRRTKNVTPPARRLSLIENLEEKAVRIIFEWRRAMLDQTYDVDDHWPSFNNKLDDAAHGR